MKFFYTEWTPGRTVQTTDGKELLYFSGTDYLGLAHNESLRTLFLEGLERYGMHYGSSRNNSLRLAVYEAAERSVTQFSGAPDALLTSSGIWAGQLVLRGLRQVFGQSQPVFHTAPGAHPAIRSELNSTSVSWAAWSADIAARLAVEDASLTHIICTDAVGSPFVEAFDFTLFAGLKTLKNVWFLVDESHTLGVSGEDGRGLYAQLQSLLGKRLIVVSSLNKAMGIPAGVILGPEDVLTTLRQSPWFAGGSPPAPAYVWAFDKLLESGVLAVMYQSLKDNIIYFQGRISADWFRYIAGYPVHCSRETRLHEHLLDHGIMTSCFAYPGPDDAAVTRVSISALHQKEDLDKLIEVCQSFFS